MASNDSDHIKFRALPARVRQAAWEAVRAKRGAQAMIYISELLECAKALTGVA